MGAGLMIFDCLRRSCFSAFLSSSGEAYSRYSTLAISSGKALGFA
jgi:hypothetical protein